MLPVAASTESEMVASAPEMCSPVAAEPGAICGRINGMATIPTDEELDDIERDLELEATIAALVARKNAAREGSAERRFLVRQLTGLYYGGGPLAGPIIEDFDPYW